MRTMSLVLMPQRIPIVALAVLLAAWFSCPAARAADALADALAGGEFSYTLQAGDSLTSVGARFGVAPRVLAQENGLRTDTRLKPGQVLLIDNRHIVAQRLDQGILINIPQRMLFYFNEGTPEAGYPVGLGRPDWATPTGDFAVMALQENKTWVVPPSIQEEMRREGKPVLTSVPPGPDNPLGKHWIGLSLPGYGIHGTIAPPSVYQFSSHGCIRLHPDDVAQLFQKIHLGDRGKIIYAPVLLARTGDGRIYLEVHRDIYGKGSDPLSTVRSLAAASNLIDLLDWRRAEAVIREQDGVAREVGLPMQDGPKESQ